MCSHCIAGSGRMPKEQKRGTQATTSGGFPYRRKSGAERRGMSLAGPEPSSLVLAECGLLFWSPETDDYRLHLQRCLFCRWNSGSKSSKPGTGPGGPAGLPVSRRVVSR